MKNIKQLAIGLVMVLVLATGAHAASGGAVLGQSTGQDH